MFWERESSTVEQLFALFKQALDTARHLEITPTFMTCKSVWPVGDQEGFGEAMVMLWQSLQKGKTEGSLKQFNSIRKLRSLSANMQLASKCQGMDGVCFKDGGSAYLLTRCTTNSVLFTKFIKGCEKRMGRMIKQDAALSVSLLLLILTNMNREFQLADVGIE
jgi:hypothetical protein